MCKSHRHTCVNPPTLQAWLTHRPSVRGRTNWAAYTHTHAHGFGLLGYDCSRLVEGSTANIAGVAQRKNWTRPTPQMHGLHIHTRTRFWLLGMTLLGVAQRKNSTRPTPQSLTRSDTLAGRGFIGADACQPQNCMEQETALRNSSMFSADQLRALALNLDLRGWPIRNVLFICTQMSSTAGSKIWAIKSCS